ncbi:2-polyprenyl-6-methoxyphenol hydroxylase [Streptomyces sp. NRRL F-4489]|uniref:FAD-dependent oxidoreductase n=1 Tax=Streptomyces sp. NRRL F-4489 TaxID=1609095 RepID=UPI0007492636|nr:FAD-dependent oxidoreductase [Streptomyces sp. NRRL F-4489]KUL43827.1 2-polyprenyl-6-methoxyphenol hydroxylase [Streptomyces sp. NRRL F-4489]
MSRPTTRPTPRSVLVVGGGTAGNGLTVLLRRAGIAVDLVEAEADWNATAGSGITLQGNALRVLREIGVWEQVRDLGFPSHELAILAVDGTVRHVRKDIRTGGDGLPATVGMRRPQLQRLLIDAVRASGARVRLGTTVTGLRQDAGGVDVRFSDGGEGRYDLVVAADGLNSATRALIGIEDRPAPTGMAIWRAPAPRPRHVRRTEIVYGGPCFIAGYCPTSEHTVYAYLAERNRDRATLPPSAYAEEMRALAAGYGGAWEEIRASITDSAQVNYTWFDRLLVEGPWHRGRVVLAGDAAHCCPPTLAQGAAMSLEDIAVLAELLTTRADWDDRLFADYRDRRLPRVRTVVDASVRLGQWLLDGVRDADVPGLIGRTMAVLEEQP